MSTWYCCKLPMEFCTLCLDADIYITGACGEGGYGSWIGSCQGCGHVACSCCNVEDHSHSYDTLASASQSPSTSTTASIALNAASTRQYTCTSSSYQHDHHTGQEPIGPVPYYGPVTEGERVFRWTCCQCYGDNNYKLEPQCNHNYCGHTVNNACCTIYEVRK
jgi:hypothetical protein